MTPGQPNPWNRLEGKNTLLKFVDHPRSGRVQETRQYLCDSVIKRGPPVATHATKVTWLGVAIANLCRSRFRSGSETNLSAVPVFSPHDSCNPTRRLAIAEHHRLGLLAIPDRLPVRCLPCCRGPPVSSKYPQTGL